MHDTEGSSLRLNRSGSGSSSGNLSNSLSRNSSDAGRTVRRMYQQIVRKDIGCVSCSHVLQ